MKQSGKALPPMNLQEFLDSADNAAKEGQQQFFTPPNLAEVLCRPLSMIRTNLILDLNFGNGALATAAAAHHALGLDIDPRVTDQLTVPDGRTWDVTCADVTRWYPLSVESGFQAPFILLNPPFSLRWHADRLAPLRDSAIPEVAAIAKSFGTHVDSTLASLLIALDRLHPVLGEGFMVCNASTARRFFGPDSPHASLRQYLYLWLEIPGTVFENVAQVFDTAVLYFSVSHARRGTGQPLQVTSPSADPSAVAGALFSREVMDANCGSRFRYSTELHRDTIVENFRSIAAEYHRRYHGARPEWNIQLDAKGRIRTHLTPFQKVSRKLDRELVARLHSLNGHVPLSLCVTATSRTALREAAGCGVWTIQPAVHEAITAALAAYEAEGAPFYPPNETRALGWVDELSRIQCKSPGIGTCRPGEWYGIASTIENTTWKGHRVNILGETEDLQYEGRELLVTLTDDSGRKHHFHVRKDDALVKPEGEANASTGSGESHWWIEDLINHFAIPIPADIATLRPEAYAANRSRLGDLENLVNQRRLASVA